MSPTILRLICIYFFGGWTIHRGRPVALMTMGMIPGLYGQNAEQVMLAGSFYCSCVSNILR